MNPQAVLFDLDGTLVDSAPDLALCIDRTMVQLGLPERGLEKVRLWMGNGPRRLMERALLDDLDCSAPVAQVDEAFARLLENYGAHDHSESRVYEGVHELLTALDGRSKTAIVTNKLERFVDPLLARLGLNNRFEVIVGGDTLAHRKPHPAPLLHAAELLGVAAADCLMVGDSCNDIGAARAANMPVVCVSYGYNHGDDIHDQAPDHVLESLAELPALLVAPS